MELRHVKYFLTVAEELNFRKASEKLSMSQPPLSRQIKELEIELGAKLFDRTNKSVKLTEAGKYFESELQEMMEKLDTIKARTRKIAENLSGDYHIAYIGSTFSSAITNLVPQLREQYPYLNIKLYEMSKAQQIEELERGRLDLGVMRAPVVSKRIDIERWFQDTYSLVFKKGQLDLVNTHDISGLKDEVFVFYGKEYAPGYYDTLVEICARHGFSPKIGYETNNINSILQLVKNGMGISIVPSSQVEINDHDDLTFMELSENDLFTEVLIATPEYGKHEITNTAVAYLTK